MKLGDWIEVAGKIDAVVCTIYNREDGEREVEAGSARSPLCSPAAPRTWAIISDQACCFYLN